MINNYEDPDETQAQFHIAYLKITCESFDLRRLMVPPFITPFSQQLLVCVDVDVMPKW